MFPIARTLVIAKDARRAAQISCALALPGHYLPVVEGPRFLPPDPTTELVRQNDAAARVRPESIFMTGLSDKAFDTLTARLVSPAQTTRVSQLIPFRQLGRNIALLSLIDIVALSTPLHWSGPFACAVQRKLQIIDSAWYVRINRDERIAG
jgi:hypothetical protein